MTERDRARPTAAARAAPAPEHRPPLAMELVAHGLDPRMTWINSDEKPSWLARNWLAVLIAGLIIVRGK